LECCCNVDSGLQTFKQAFQLFKNGASATELYKLLSSKVPKFKVALEAAFAQPNGTLFKVPVPVSILGKRKNTELSYNGNYMTQTPELQQQKQPFQ